MCIQPADLRGPDSATQTTWKKMHVDSIVKQTDAITSFCDVLIQQRVESATDDYPIEMPAMNGASDAIKH